MFMGSAVASAACEGMRGMRSPACRRREAKASFNSLGFLSSAQEKQGAESRGEEMQS